MLAHSALRHTRIGASRTSGIAACRAGASCLAQQAAKAAPFATAAAAAIPRRRRHVLSSTSSLSTPMTETQNNRGDALVPSAAASAAAAPPQAVAECVVGPALWELAVSTGSAKSVAPLSRVLPLSVLAGAFIGFGASLALALGGSLAGAVHPATQRLVFGAVGFQVGLLAIAVTGSELFTGNAFFFASALLEKKAQLKDVVPRAVVCWLGNFAGVALVAGLLALGSTGGAAVAPSAAPAAALAAAKAALPPLAALARAVLCNVCVCVAVAQATSARSMAGKAVGIWLPLSCFASLGLEHSIANMFIFSLAEFTGQGASLVGAAANLLVVSFGNVVGAAAVLAVLLKLGHGSK